MRRVKRQTTVIDPGPIVPSVDEIEQMLEATKRNMKGHLAQEAAPMTWGGIREYAGNVEAILRHYHALENKYAEARAEIARLQAAVRRDVLRQAGRKGKAR